MLKHFFFDLDNTLTKSRTVMPPEHAVIFKAMCDAYDVAVVSGAQESQIRTQIPDATQSRFYVLAQTGNQCVNKDGTVLWKEVFSEPQTTATLSFIGKIKSELNLNVKDPNDLIELRGSQISYSPIGHNEDLAKKSAFDPGAQKRRTIIETHADDVSALKQVGVDVVPGGTTCFDFFLAGKNKGFNVTRLIERELWRKDECLYMGDALFPGGNDETVIGVIATHSVQSPEDTFDFISGHLL